MLPLFIVETLPESGEVHITGDEARHAISAVRIKANELIALTDGCGAKATAKVLEVERKSLLVQIVDRQFKEKSEIKLSVLQALTKGDRARETIELLTETGVDQIFPWAAQRSIGQWKDDHDSQSKWQMWAREATKQSRRSWFPQVATLQTLSDITERFSDFDLVLLFHESDGAKLSSTLNSKLSEKTVRSALIIIGPEGGITDEEVNSFLAAGALSVNMGEPIFRSAHAGAAALAAVQTALGIW